MLGLFRSSITISRPIWRSCAPSLSLPLVSLFGSRRSKATAAESSGNSREPSPKIEQIVNAIKSGDRLTVSRAITLVESSKPEHQDDALDLLEALHDSKKQNTIRIGITGPPGVGKSTFIEAFGKYVTQLGHKIAVLAIDPTSVISGGSILGDRTRMLELSVNEKAFIRPSPSSASLGGIRPETTSAISIVESAGYDVVVVETVGVGQNEVSVADIVDVFILLLAPANGDELQGIKKGIVEMADLVVINKCDGDLEAAARRTLTDYESAVHIQTPKWDLWTPRVMLCSAIGRNKKGIDTVWETVQEFKKISDDSGMTKQRRGEQAIKQMWNAIQNMFLTRLKNSRVRHEVHGIEVAVKEGAMAPMLGARVLWDVAVDNDRRK